MLEACAPRFELDRSDSSQHDAVPSTLFLKQKVSASRKRKESTVKRILPLIVVLTFMVLGTITQGTRAAKWTADMKEGKVTLQSMGPLAFGPDGILFAADTKAAALVAIATGDTAPVAIATSA